MRIFACKITVHLFVPHEWGIEHERILRMITRMRRVVPRSTTNEYLELVLGTANGNEGVEVLKHFFIIH